MRRHASLAAIVVTCLSGCEAVAPAFTAEHRAAIVDSVHTMLADFRAAVGTLDGDSVATFYVADSTLRWIEDGTVRYTARAQIAQAFHDFRGAITGSRLLYDGTVVTPLAPGVAVMSSGFAQQFARADGTSGGFAGAVSAVVVHRGDRWLFQSGHTSSAPPPPTEGAAPRS